ncbi:hypothetical protein HYW87_01200, partial [Candidatus Roizmanbacteria bacterium]|nr:hypothetical protein [Candidatus Roizmanbacteria bacterium]
MKFKIVFYTLFIAVCLSTLILFKPFRYVDNQKSYIVCKKDNSHFEIGPNLIYTFTQSLDDFNDKKARKLCEYKTIRDYADSQKTPQEVNYIFYPVYTTESSWSDVLFSSMLIFAALVILIRHKKNVPTEVKATVTFAIEVLFWTTAWIFVYTQSVIHLRFIFPPKPNDNFLILGVYPEPFEIPLYLVLTFLFIYLIYALRPRITDFIMKIPKSIQYVLFILLAVLFLQNLGEFPLQTPLSEKSLFIPLVYLFTSCFFIFEMLILEHSHLKDKLKNIWIYSIVFCLIAIFTFPPRFVISGVDYSYFYGPIWEITQGKTIFTEISSQYGFLSILFLSVLHKVALPLSYLPILVWALFVIQYFLCFHLIFKQSKSLAFGLLGLFCILTFNYFAVRVIPTDYPQAGPLRWLPLILSLFMLSRAKHFTSHKLIFFIALASFWMIDVGIELLLAYAFSLYMLVMIKRESIKYMIKALSWLFIFLLAIFIFIQTVHIALGYTSVNFLAVFTKLQQYSSSGFGMLPIESKTYFWIGILFYFASILYAFQKNERTLLFSANLTLLASIYYVGRSHPAELYTVSLFIFLNAFLLLSLFYRDIKTLRIKIITLAFLFFFFILFPAFHRTVAIASSIETRIQRFMKGDILKPEMDEVLEKKYSREKHMIQEAFPEKEILVISGDDTYLL